MKIFKKILTIATITIIMIIILENNSNIATGISTNYRAKFPVKIGLFAKDLNDDYLVFLKESFEDIQKENEGKVSFSFYDAKFNKAQQKADIDINLNKGIDLILLDIVDINDLKEEIKKIAQYNIPVIVFNR